MDGSKDGANVRDRQFYEWLPGVFSYPLRGQGKGILAVAVGWGLLIDLMAFLTGVLGVLGILTALATLLLAVAYLVYIGNYYLKVLDRSARGRTEPPGWVEPHDFIDAIVPPLRVFAGSAIVSFLPLFAYWFLTWRMGGEGSAAVYWVLLALGLFYLPMAMLATELLNTVLAASPHIVIPSIVKVIMPYLVVCCIIAGAVGLEELLERLTAGIPFLGNIFRNAISFYVAVMVMHLLGVLYWTNDHRLQWFGEL